MPLSLAAQHLKSKSVLLTYLSTTLDIPTLRIELQFNTMIALLQLARLAKLLKDQAADGVVNQMNVLSTLMVALTRTIQFSTSAQFSLNLTHQEAMFKETSPFT